MKFYKLSPNSSFLQQLRLFEQLNYSANPSALRRSTIYRDFIATNEHLFSSDHGLLIFFEMIAELDLTDPSCIYSLEESRIFSSEKKYSCKMCRKKLFYDFNVINHLNAKEAENKTSCDFQYLLTPIEWMELSGNSGKVNNIVQFFIPIEFIDTLPELSSQNRLIKLFIK